MQERYLAATCYRLLVPGIAVEVRVIAQTLTRFTRWNIGIHDGFGWFHVEPPIPIVDLTEKIVAVAVGHAITHGDEQLLIIRKADATVLVCRTTGGLEEVDRFQLPENS
jgi:hypothetical protein